MIKLPEHVARLEAEKRALQDELARATQFALVDALTGLMNRRALDNTLDEIQAEVRQESGFHTRRAPRSPDIYGFLALDLAGFKKVNDTHGHAVGDQALVAAANAIRASIRTTDRLVFRPGGDEFTVLLRDVNLEEARIVANRIIQNIEAVTEWSLSARIGGAIWDTGAYPGAEPRAVLAMADNLELALRQVRRNGESDIRIFAP